MKPFLQKNSRGFSLVETIIYLGLLVLVMVGIVNLLLLMSRTARYLETAQHVQTSATVALDRMVRDIRNAQSVDVAQSTLGTNPGVLTLNTTTVAGVAQTLQFYVLNGAVRVKQDGVDLGPLTLSDVTVSSLVFNHITTSVSRGVKVSLSLSSGAQSASFYSTAVLRDSY